MDRGAWWATVHGVTRVGHGLATKQQQQFLGAPPPCWLLFTWGSLPYSEEGDCETIQKVFLAVFFFCSSLFSWRNYCVTHLLDRAHVISIVLQEGTDLEGEKVLVKLSQMRSLKIEHMISLV